MIQKDYYLLAAQRSDYATVEAMVRQNEVDVDVTDEIGVTALIRAAERGDSYMVSSLLLMGADVNKKAFATGETAILNAVENNHIKVVEQLLENGADVNCADHYGKTPLLSAVSSKNVVMTKRLLKAGADYNKANNYGQTPLMRAVLSGDMGLITVLAENGADINRQDQKGQTALQYAVINQNREQVALLVDYGVDINHKNKEGKTALDIAYETKDVKMFEFLSKYLGADTNNMLYSHQQGITQTPEYKISAIVNQKEAICPDVQNILLKALKEKDIFDLYEKLELPFVDINMRYGEEKQTLLMKSVILEDREAFEIIFTHGADRNIKDAQGFTAKDLLLQSIQKNGITEDKKKMLDLFERASRFVQRARVSLSLLKKEEYTRF